MADIPAAPLPASTAQTGNVPSGGNLARLRGDLAGGVVSSVISLSEAIPLGLMAFAALGPAFAPAGVPAGLYGAAFAGFVAAALGGTPRLISGPRASVIVIVAAMVASLSKAPNLEEHGGATMVIALTFLGIFLAGVLEALFGFARLGRAIKFAPYPVIAGFMNGVAILLLVAQFKGLLGLPEDFTWAQWREITELGKPWNLAVAAVTILIIAIVPKIARALPSLLLGLLGGVAAYHIVGTFVGMEALGAVLGEVPRTLPTPTALLPLGDVEWNGWLLARLLDIMPSVIVLAVIGSIDSLMSAAALDSLTHTRHDSNRELIAQGLSNMAAAAMGGLASSGAIGRSAASLTAGANSRAAGMISAALVLVAAVVAGPWLGALPQVVLAAVLIVVAFGMLDSWSRELLPRLRNAESSYKRTIAANLIVVMVVAGVTVAVNLIAAVAVGILISMFLFVTQMSKPIVRHHYDGRARHSLKVRTRAEAELLAAHGGDIVVIEMDGPLFFGTADALLTQVENLASQARVVILDFRRVSEMDSTGIRLLLQLARLMLGKRKIPLIAHMMPEQGHGRFVSAIGGNLLFQLARIFPDTDAAMEWAEDHVVALHGYARGTGDELELSQFSIAQELSAEELKVLTSFMQRREVSAGSILFREGEPGQSLFLLAQGSVTIRLTRGDGATIRLAALIPGVMFGEMAILESRPRSADAVADVDAVVYAIDTPGVRRIIAEYPALATKLMANMAREIAARLRVTNDRLRVIS